MRKGKGTFEIVGIKTLNGYFISDEPNATYGTTLLSHYLIDGEKPEKTFNDRWVKVKQEPKSIQTKKSQPDINHRYELIDESLESEKFPKVLKRDDVAYYNEDDYYWVWNDEYSHLRSLYKEVSDKQPSVLVDVEFTYETILELDELKSGEGFSYPVQRTQWTHDGTKEFTKNDVHQRLIDQIAFPSIVHTSLPSKITSEQMYSIVRQHVKENIDHSVARITSDYDFCFTVKRRVQLNNPFEKKREILKSNGRSYANPKYDTRYIKEREIEIFEMTHAGKKYDNYTVIAGLEAENLEQLQEKIDLYLEKLMNFINTPVKECPCCDGRGIEINDAVSKWVLNENKDSLNEGIYTERRGKKMDQRERFLAAGIPYDDLDVEMIDLIDVLNFKLNIQTKYCCYGHDEINDRPYVVLHESVTDEQIYHLAEQFNKLMDWTKYGVSFNKWVRFYPVKTNWKIGFKKYRKQNSPEKKAYIDSVVRKFNSFVPLKEFVTN